MFFPLVIKKRPLSIFFPDFLLLKYTHAFLFSPLGSCAEALPFQSRLGLGSRVAGTWDFAIHGGKSQKLLLFMQLNATSSAAHNSSTWALLLLALPGDGRDLERWD